MKRFISSLASALIGIAVLGMAYVVRADEPEENNITITESLMFMIYDANTSVGSDPFSLHLAIWSDGTCVTQSGPQRTLCTGRVSGEELRAIVSFVQRFAEARKVCDIVHAPPDASLTHVLCPISTTGNARLAWNKRVEYLPIDAQGRLTPEGLSFIADWVAFSAIENNILRSVDWTTEGVQQLSTKYPLDSHGVLAWLFDRPATGK